MNTRNLPCPCGSGKKHKKCCILKEIEADNAALKKKQEDRRKLEAYRATPEGRAAYLKELQSDGPGTNAFNNRRSAMAAMLALAALGGPR